MFMKYRLLLLVFILGAVTSSKAQSGRELLQNGDFSNTTTAWTTACTNVEALYPETTYGGTVATNIVAEVDDESCFYQNACILPGLNYILEVKASRRSIAESSISTNIKVEGLNAANVVVGAALVNYTFNRTNTTFSLTPVTGIPVITVPAAGGIVRLKITFTDATPGTATLGMIIDDISLKFQNAPVFNADTTTCINTNTAMSLANLTGAVVTYAWSFGGGAVPVSATLAGPTVSWATTGTKAVSCILSNGTCPVDTIRRNIEVGVAALPVVTSPVTYCEGATATALTATGTNLQWYTTPTGGTGSSTAPVPVTTVAGTTTYYVSQVSGQCESNRVPVVVIIHPGVTAAFDYMVQYGCAGDTVQFTNRSAGTGTFTWNFGDNNGSGLTSPLHTYLRQDVYTVKLVHTGGFCKDSITRQIDLKHPLQAAFVVDKDTLCQNQTVNFTNTSVATTRNGMAPTYQWDFGDGDTSSLQHPSHTYTTTGIFRVVMRVTDFVPCTDSFVKIIYVDTASGLSLISTDTVFCAGQRIEMNASYLPVGFQGLTWDFGDATIIQGVNPAIHAYESTGLFTVTVKAAYRVCPDTTVTKTILVKPFPRINIGPDTFMCPNAGAMTLSDYINRNNASASWLWNTGSTQSSLLITAPGTYSATVSIDGCSATDSITVNKDCYVDIPNSFTPNGDGLNDYFFPRTQLSHAVVQFTMQVFNRWGQVIFETRSIDGRGWDGRFNSTVQPQGVYIYIIDVVFANGVKEHYTGNVTLLR
jgi:gliding motility-associated-like protein